MCIVLMVDYYIAGSNVRLCPGPVVKHSLDSDCDRLVSCPLHTAVTASKFRHVCALPQQLTLSPTEVGSTDIGLSVMTVSHFAGKCLISLRFKIPYIKLLIYVYLCIYRIKTVVLMMMLAFLMMMMLVLYW